MQKTIRLKKISFIFVFLTTYMAPGQDSFQKNYDFLQHLDKIEAYKEGIFFIEKSINKYDGTKRDTLNYLSGHFNYSIKNINESIQSFKMVEQQSNSLFIRSQFFIGFQYAYLRKYDSAKVLSTLNVNNDSFLNELKSVELASISLLERDFESFDTYSQNFSGSYYQLTNTEERLKLNKEGLLKVKKKSPALAGVLSGVLPGAGKFYVGKAGEGYLTLLLSTIMGLQLREAYKKDGINSTRFKIYSGLFGAIYVANIWGSVLSVKIYKKEVNETYDEAILLNMHVPLRTIFD
ncbi:hypothetical protein [Ekhidna sp.]|uniref:hypothetical protein n=1 Tax=Ekhidna sp. TaxID=2608089 RepID=UPI003BAB82BC